MIQATASIFIQLICHVTLIFIICVGLKSKQVWNRQSQAGDSIPLAQQRAEDQTTNCLPALVTNILSPDRTDGT